MADIEKIKLKGTDYTVVDSTVPSHVRSITQQNITSWNNKQDALTAGDGIAIDSNDTIRTIGIPYGVVDSTSTSKVFTATVPGIDRLENGVCVMLKNGVVTSAAGFTININGLGAKPAFNNMTAATRETTIFNINYTMLFVYDATRVVDSITGAWVCYRGYDANTNTIGYQLRTNSTVMTVTDTARYYKIYFTSADGAHWVPASVNSTNNATSARPVNQRPINPFGRIVFTSANSNYAAGANLAATTIWDQYTLTLGYSFNRTGAALTLTTNTPVYVKCAPQTNGSAIMDATTPIVQALPTTNDGKIYIFLGVAYSATAIELVPNHPVYYHDGTGIKLWTGSTGGGGDLSNYYTKTEVDTALSGKQATLVSGTNLKTVNSTSLLGSGNVAVQPTLVSGTNIKTINNESLLGSGNISIQGGGGSGDNHVYNISRNALVISPTTYTVTKGGSETSVVVYDRNENPITFPFQVTQGDELYISVSGSYFLSFTMGGSNCNSDTSGYLNDRIYYVIYKVTGDVVVTINSMGGGGAND